MQPNSTSAKMLCKRIVIEGLTSNYIQGVNLRERVENFVRGTINADNVMVKGKISNLQNGRVEIIFCGSDSDLDRIKLQLEELTKTKKDEKETKRIKNINTYEYEVDDKLFSDFTIERSDDLSEMVWALRGAGNRFVESTEVLAKIYHKIQERDERTALSRLLALHYELMYNKPHLQNINDFGDKISLVALNASIENPILSENDFVLPLTDVVFALTELKNAKLPLLNNFNTDDIKHDIESLDSKILILLKDRYNVSLQT
jgi:acylphosphatase